MLDTRTITTRALGCLPTPWRFACIRRLASRPSRPPSSQAESDAYRSGRPLSLGPRGRIPAREWGTGETVALVHGWGGRAAQLAPLALRLAEQGHRAVVFDVAGHGESKVGEARWEWFIRDIREVADALGPLHAFIGHSAGGLSMMAARATQGLGAARYACICAPLYPYPPIRGIRERLRPGEAVLDRYRRFLAGQFGMSWDALERGEVWRGSGPELLVCHDDRDRFVDPQDGARVQALCPKTRVKRTSGHGHVRILASAELASTLVDFLGPAS